MTRRSVRFRLTMFVGGLFCVALVVTGWGVRILLDRSLRADAVANAEALLDEHLRLGATGVVSTELDPDDAPRLAYYSAQGRPLTWSEVDMLLTNALEVQLAAVGPILDADGVPITIETVTEAAAGTVVFSSGVGPDGAPLSPTPLAVGPHDEALLAAIETLPDLDPPIAVTDTDGARSEVTEREGVLLVTRSVVIGDTPASVGVSTPTAPIDAAIRTYTTSGLLAIPPLAALVAAATWITASRALRPVEQIRRQVERTDPDALDRHVPTTGADDEIDRLAGTMNDLLDRLHEAADRRRRFISDASHELRSPITATLATLETVSPDHDDWDASVRILLREQRQLAELVDDLLLLATLDEHRLPGTEDQPVDLDEIALQASARPRSVPVEVHIDAPHRVLGRNDLLRRAVVNLVDNAAHHARSRVRVTVTTSDDGRPRVVVDDDGPGVAPADRCEIFERFRRVDEARNRRDGGAGLGLAIVRDVATRHGADVVVGDGPLGGARFELRFSA